MVTKAVILVVLAIEVHSGAFEEWHITSQHLQKLHTLVDENLDGKVTEGELLAHSSEVDLEHAMRYTLEVWQEIDLNQDGWLDIAEYRQYCQTEPPNQTLKANGSYCQDEQCYDATTDQFTQADKLLVWEQELKKFLALDQDKDGTLSPETTAALLFPFIHEQLVLIDVNSKVVHQDRNGDGQLSQNEFLSQAGIADFEDAVAEFLELDRDGDGQLSHAELAQFESGRFHARKAMGDFIVLADADGDGGLTLQEMGHLVQRFVGTAVQPYLELFTEHHKLGAAERHSFVPPSSTIRSRSTAHQYAWSFLEGLFRR